LHTSCHREAASPPREAQLLCCKLRKLLGLPFSALPGASRLGASHVTRVCEESSLVEVEEQRGSVGNDTGVSGNESLVRDSGIVKLQSHAPENERLYSLSESFAS
jgi:hypothetical protein